MAERIQAPNQLLYRVANLALVRPAIRLMGGVTVHYLAEHEPLAGPHLLAPNHPSGRLDVPIVGSLQLERDSSTMHAIATSSLVTNRFKGWLFKNLGALFIDKDKRTIDPAVIERTGQIFDKNGVILGFPEGETTYSDSIARHGSKAPKRSVVALAINYGVPIQPVGISGTAPGDIGNFHVVIGSTLEVEQKPVDLQDTRAVVSAAKPYMDDLYDRMNDALQMAHKLRAEYTAEHPIPSNPMARFLINQLSQKVPAN